MSILVCGEALYDLFQTGEDAAGGLIFDAQPGGSPFNVAIGIARLGGQAALLSGLSTDMLGARLFDRLTAEGVETRYLLRNGRRTTLSVVGLDQDGGPDYAFYGVGSADCALTEADMPDLPDGIRALHFGSYSLVLPPVADALAALAGQHADRFISLDPNIRPSIEPDMRIWRDRIDAFRPHANLIKVSAEDLALLYDDQAPEAIARRWAGEHPCLVVLTAGSREMTAYRGETSLAVTPPRVEVADTVGAGDAVQACLLAELQARDAFDMDAGALSDEALTGMLDQAAAVGARTCSVRGATIPLI